MSHQHRSTLSQSNKPFKGKSKGKNKRENKGKIVAEPMVSVKKAAIVGTRKGARVNKARQLQKNKKQLVALAKRLGTDQGPAKIVGIIPLSSRVDLVNPLQFIEAACDNDALVPPTNPRLKILRTSKTRPKQRIVVYAAPRTVDAVLDIAKVADVLLFVVAPTEDNSDIDLDPDAWQLTTVVKAQGVPTSLGLMQGISGLPLKKRQNLENTANRFFQTALEITRKPLNVDSPEDGELIVRILATVKLGSLGWRADRAYVLAESVEIRVNPDQTASVRVAGHIRGNATMTANMLVHATGFGDFQLEQVDNIIRADAKARHMQEQPQFAVQLHSVPDANQESLVALKPLDEMNREQSIITDAEIQAAQMNNSAAPDGLAKFQSIWDEIDDDDDDEPALDKQTDSALDSMVCDDDAMDEEDAPNNLNTVANSKIDWSTLSIEKKLKAEQDELEYPGEIDTPGDVRANVRFARYRGMKSFVSSQWDVKENLPMEYGHIAQFENIERAARRVITEAKAHETGLRAGAHCVLQLARVPVVQAQQMAQGQAPLVIWGLYQHERQVSVLHCRVRRHPDDVNPVRTKEPLSIHMGFRRFTARPVFSQEAKKGRNNRALTSKFLHKDTFTMASFYGHIYFPPAPVLMFRQATAEDPEPPMLASGNLACIDPDKLLLKKILLTGNPIGVHKNSAVVRWMFHNPADIKWFKPVELRTKYGFHGHIIESRGNKGLLKARFDGHLKAHDTVCMPLYKRQFPKWVPELFE